MGPSHSGLWEISCSSGGGGLGCDKTGALLPFLSPGESRTISRVRADVAVGDHSHKGDYSNHLIPELRGVCAALSFIFPFPQTAAAAADETSSISLLTTLFHSKGPA